jgi:hypothetical protein
MSTAQGLTGGDQEFAIEDLSMAELAARELWPIRKSLRADAVDRMATIIRDPASSAREVTAAVRALSTFSKINLQSIAQMQKAEEQASAHDRRSGGKYDRSLTYFMPRRTPIIDKDSQGSPEPAAFAPTGHASSVTTQSSSGAGTQTSAASSQFSPVTDPSSVVLAEPSAVSPPSSAIGDRASVITRPSSDTSASASADCPEPSGVNDPSSGIAHSLSPISPEPSSFCPVPSSVSDSSSASCPCAPPPTPVAAPTSPVPASVSHQASLPPIGRRPSVIDSLPLELVTHLELFAEDPSPSAPAIERRDRARIRFRVGKGVDLWVPPPALHALLPPGPERDLLFNNRLQVCRVDDPSRYEPD